VDVTREGIELLDIGLLYSADVTSLFEADHSMDQFFRERSAVELTDVLLSSDTRD
jgi:hypothetical protein